MKKINKKTDFEYGCFICHKQDDKARTYTRSYDLILHMVNTHRKFPVEARHNAFYAADGSDVRDATREEVEKYRLAVAHKRRKPETESSCEKSGSTTTVRPVDPDETTRARKDDDRGRKGDSSRSREDDRRTSSYDKDWKTGRPLSRDSTKEREASSRGSKKVETPRHQGKKDAGGRSTDREKKKRESADVTDDDERDQRKMEEIMRRMEERKLAKDAELKTKDVGDATTPALVTGTMGSKERRPGTDDKSTAERVVVDIRHASEKVPAEKKKVPTADCEQRKQARVWAAGDVSDTSVVTQSTGEKASARQRGAKKTTERKTVDSAEVTAATYVQNFVAAQYPPMDEGVSSTVRLGRAFVSGAFGRRTDDPKLFEAAVNITECSVRLLTTNKKAKTPVSDPPPNSIDSEMDRGDISDARLSQSATDLDVQIELPNMTAESTFLEMVGPFDEEVIGGTHSVPGVVESPIILPVVTTPVNMEISMSGSGGSSGETREGREKVPTPRSVVLAEYNQLLKEIEASTMTQEELRHSEPGLASAASFHEIVTRGVEEGRRLKKNEGNLGQSLVTRIAETTVGEAARFQAKYNEKQRTIRITAAKSLLEEELAKTNPFLPSVAAFHKAAYGEESVVSTPEIISDTLQQGLTTGAGISIVSEQPSTRGQDGGAAAATGTQRGIEAEGGTIEDVAEIVSDDEDAMSVGDSEGETSDGFSGSGRSTSGGESMRSRGSRKRPADDSPEREPTEAPRRGFPGAITRSDSGCRVHIPPTRGSTPAPNAIVGVPENIAPNSTVVGASNITIDEALCEVVVEGAVEMTSEGRIPTTRCSVSAKEPVLPAEMVAGPILNIGVVSTAEEVKMPVITERPRAGGETRREEPEICTLVSNTPETSTTTTESVLGIAYMREEANVVLPLIVDVTVGQPATVGVAALVRDSATIIATTTIPGIGVENGDGGGGGDGTGGRGSSIGARFGAATAVSRPRAEEGWGRDAHMVEGIFRIIEGMEPPWITVDVLEAVALQFPTVDRETLRLVIMTVMMAQRRCVVRLTRAGLRLGPRVDSHGSAFVELDLEYADRYSNSH